MKTVGKAWIGVVIGLALTLAAWEPAAADTKLSGTAFGTAPWGPGAEFGKASDGITTTYFDSVTQSSGYTGIDLGNGAARRVSKVRYYPRAGQAGRMTGGKFQGSNTSTNSGYTDIYTIPSAPSYAWTEATVANATAWRYLRYYGPANGYCNIAEMEFYTMAAGVDNGAGATNVARTSATLRGTLTDTGTAATAVFVYWGTSNGGTNPSSWQGTNKWAAPQSLGSFNHSISGLTSNRTYYYTFSATNAGGRVWAAPSATFITADLSIEALDAAASEEPVDTGKFRIGRPLSATNVALTVAYRLRGSASNGVDYTFLSGTTNMAAGATNVDITVRPIPDVTVEAGGEQVTLTLLPGRYALGSVTSATVNVADAVVSTWYVKPTGNDASNGTSWASALKTVSNAVKRATLADVILVTNGTYVFNGQIYVTNAITIRGLSRSGVVLRRSVTGNNTPKHRIFHVNHAGAVLERLTIAHGNAENGTVDGGGGVRLAAGLLADCVVSNSYGYQDHLGIGVYVGNGGVVSNCVITHSAGTWDRNKGGGAYIASGGLVTHSVLKNGLGYCAGLGAYVDGGTLRRTDVINNNGGNAECHGGGVYLNGGLAEFCVITNNVSGNWSGGRYGGGAYMASGTLRNCLVAGNRTTYNGAAGGGVYMTGGTVESCTVAGNHAMNGENIGSGGGLYATAGTVLNTIVYENTATTSNNVWLSGTVGVTYSCATPLPAGTGNTDGNPFFKNSAAGDYTLDTGSSGFDAGSDQGWMTAGVKDLSGDRERKLGARVDIGAYELAESLGCNFEADVTRGVAPLNVEFTGYVSGVADPSVMTFYWDFENDGTWDNRGVALSNVTHQFAAGVYDVRLTVSNGAEVASRLMEDYIMSVPVTMYVATNGGHKFPYASWGDAATNIATPLAIAVDGVTILISNGTHIVAGQLLVDRAIAIRGMSRDATIVRRRVTGDSSPKHRIFRVTHSGAVLEKLTIAHGHALNATDNNYGGGVRLDKGLLTDCVITNCYGNQYHWGLGVYVGNGAVVSNCVMTHGNGTWVDIKGGGAYIASGGLVTHSVLKNGLKHAYGLGAYVNGGTLRRSSVINNNAGTAESHGGGVYLTGGGLVEFCVITNNVSGSFYSYLSGGGVYMASGKLRNCLVAGNRTSASGAGGGGVYMTGGTNESCTVAGNRAKNASDLGNGGGLYATAGTVLNTIVYENTATTSNNVWLSGTVGVTYSCATPLPAGTGNTDGNPFFKDSAAGDYTLDTGSSCFDTGSDQGWMTAGVKDVSGLRDRILNARVDIGAYERENLLACNFSADVRQGLAPLDVDFAATVSGVPDPASMTYLWDFENDGTWDAQGVALSNVTHQFSAGLYDVYLVVSNGATVADRLEADYIQAVPSTLYVATNGGHHTPFGSWADAATNVASALALAVDGVTIRLSNGTHTVAGQLLVDKDITIQGMSRDTTIVRRSVTGSSLPQHRIFRVTHSGAVLEKLTIAHGHTYNATDLNYGGGVRLDAGLVRDCVVSNCYGPAGNGAGVYMTGGTLTQSRVVGSYTDNGNYYGSGIYQAGGTVRWCDITGNTTRYGAGAYLGGGLMEYCTFSNNTAYPIDGQGGGVYMTGGTLRNSLLAKNVSRRGDFVGVKVGGAGVYQTGGLSENCTIVDNQVIGSGGTAGGVYAGGGTNRNNIVYFNTSLAGVDNVTLAGAGVMTYSCATPLPSGAENIDDDPQFKNRTAGDYTLGTGSRCINAGTTQPGMSATTDLAGNQRVRGGMVDMGCFEATKVMATMIILR